MRTFNQFLISTVFLPLFAGAAPIGICLHSYSPEAPREKIECFEFDRSEKMQSGTRFFLPNGRSAVVTEYRNRGIVLYPDPRQGGADTWGELLKVYEEHATKSPATRPFLNPWIVRIRETLKQTAQQSEESAKLPTITLSDGTTLAACVLNKIDNGIAWVRHKDGVGKVPLTDLDAAEKTALALTNPEWSFEVPGVVPKDSSGMFPKIVAKNGALLLKAKFKEYAGGSLVFMAGDKRRAIPADQFPGDFAILGADVAKSIAEDQTDRTEATAGADHADGGIHRAEPGLANSGTDLSAGAPLNDGSSLVEKARQAEEETKRVIAEYEGQLAELNEKHLKQETAFSEAGGKERLERIRKNAGPYREFVVRRVLGDSGFEKLAAYGENVYEVAFLQGGSTSIVVTPEEYSSGGKAGLYLNLRDRVDVTLTSGLTDKRDVYVNEPIDDEDKQFGELYKTLGRTKSEIDKVESSIKAVSKRANQAIAALSTAAQRVAQIRPANVTVSPKLKRRGFIASVQDRNYAAFVNALKGGTLSGISAALGSSGLHSMNAQALGALEKFSPTDTAQLPTVSDIEGLFHAVRQAEFKVELITTDSGYDNRKSRTEELCVNIPLHYLSQADNTPAKATGVSENPFPVEDDGTATTVLGGGFEFPGEKTSNVKSERCTASCLWTAEKDANGKGCIEKIRVFSYAVIVFVDPGPTDGNIRKQSFGYAHARIDEWLDQKEKAVLQDFEAGRINESERKRAVDAMGGEYIGKLKTVIERF